MKLLRNFLIIFFCATNVGCSKDQLADLVLGPPKDPRPTMGVDPEFRTYVNEYESHIGSEVYNIPITFDELEPIKGGSCYTYTVRGEKFREIRINSLNWDRKTELEKKFLIFHELKHCHAGVSDHIDDLRDDGCAFSVMHTRLPSHYCLAKYEDDYIFNLFH